MKMRLFCIAIICMIISGPALFARGAKEYTELELKAAVFKGPSGFGIVKMMEENPDLGEGVNISYEVLPSPQEMVARIASGEVDFGVLPVNIAAKLFNGKGTYPMAAVTGYGLLYLLSSDPGISSWTDLESREIYTVGKGASPDYLLQYYLSQAGLEAGKDLAVNYSIQAAPMLAQALIGGKVDTAVLPEPFVTQVRSRNKAVSSRLDFQKSWIDLHGGEEGRSYPITAAVVSASLVKEQPEVVEAFYNAYRDSIAWVNANQEAAGKLIEKWDIMPAAIAAPAIPGCNLSFQSAAQARREVEGYLKVLLEYNPPSVGGKLPTEDFYLQ